MLKELSNEELGKNLRSSPLWEILLEMEKKNNGKAAADRNSKGAEYVHQ
ncbi:MAG: hypothetical protein WA144_12480 [Candidatus Methanoperedens sp.]